jgi:hypothetical protein
MVMKGEFLAVWPETWSEIWEPLAAHEVSPNDLFAELYRELVAGLKEKPSAQKLADIIEDPERSAEVFKNTCATHMAGERSLVAFFENAYEILEELAGDPLSNYYFLLLSAFIDKFSLRYDLRRPCTLCPTLPGVFQSLLGDLRSQVAQDAHLNTLMSEFEDTVRDLRFGCSDARIKACIAKQVMLLEGLGHACPGVTQKTLGAMADELRSWPHITIRDSLKKLYGFASDYPGIRHGTSAKGVLRPLEMRDMVAICILLAGFTPYITDRLDAAILYEGK